MGGIVNVALSNTIMTIPNLTHIGLVVEDIDKATKFYSKIWGIDPWEVIDEYEATEDILIVGDSFKHKLAFAEFGPTKIEFIQPLDERGIWYQFLKTHGERLHHLCFTVPDWDDRVAKAKELGGNMMVAAVYFGKRWCYFDNIPGGLIFEYMEQ